MAKQEEQPALRADRPILEQLEELALAGDKEAEKSLFAILDDPKKLAALSNLRLAPQETEDESKKD